MSITHDFIQMIHRLRTTNQLSKEDWMSLIENASPERAEYISAQAREVRENVYGKDIYIRGLIEFTNVCRNDCYYCGIRKSNPHVARYRLTEEEIFSCCRAGYDLGFRTFVLQGGEDGYFTDGRMLDLIRSIKSQWPDCALTLSIGEKPRSTYQAFFDAGADRYLLRHETYNAEHYSRLHPSSLTAAHRQQCLYDLKEIGFQTGAGFMVGSPYQTAEHLAEDMLFLSGLKPQMIGIGPFIPHHDTPFRDRPAGTLSLTLYLLGLIRLMLPTVLLPSTTALGALAENGRELGILAGANVVMPNLSPQDNRKDYSLYDNKPYSGMEAAEHLRQLKERFASLGYRIVTGRGDAKSTGGN